jgi:hypothetical protein
MQSPEGETVTFGRVLKVGGERLFCKGTLVSHHRLCCNSCLQLVHSLEVHYHPIPSVLVPDMCTAPS